MLSNHIKPENYINFEPSPIEFKYIQKSVPLAKNHQEGLSDRSGELIFYLKSSMGDSSFIKPSSYSHTISSEVTTLDAFMEKINLNSCKLLKLEAEGYEPEILDGAKLFLNICDYVAVDGGPERFGKPTLPALSNKLNKAGFKKIHTNKSKYRALYKNTARIS
jgi:FkbM family methyltransferase